MDVGKREKTPPADFARLREWATAGLGTWVRAPDMMALLTSLDAAEALATAVALHEECAADDEECECRDADVKKAARAFRAAIEKP